MASYIASSRCLLTTKSDFVVVGSEAGSVPRFAGKTEIALAGHVAGTGGGGVTLIRRT